MAKPVSLFHDVRWAPPWGRYMHRYVFEYEDILVRRDLPFGEMASPYAGLNGIPARDWEYVAEQLAEQMLSCNRGDHGK